MNECRVCAKPFDKDRMGQVVCGVRCAQKLPVINRKAEKAERKAVKQKLAALKTRSQRMKEAQIEFNRYIRLRDAAQPCISCGRHHQGQWHAGHYLSVGARPELRFCESQVHKQCQPCNVHLHGNIALYRVGLLDRIGLAELQRIEGPHEPRKYSIDDLKAIRDEYRAKAKELQREQQ